MKLYYFPLSMYSQKAIMAFREKGVAFEPEIVNLFDDEARARYLELYPIGKVPLLVLDDGHKIPESSIIIEYLDTRFDGGPRLIPEDADASRRTRFTDRMVDLYLDDSVTALIFQGRKPDPERDPELIERSRHRAGVMYDFMEKALGEHEWLLDHGFGLADCAAAPVLFYAQKVFPFADRPNVSAYWQRLSSRPSWQACEAEMSPMLEGFALDAA